MAQSSDFGATLQQSQKTMQLLTKQKKCSSEPLLAHQSGIPMRYTPHPNKNVQIRWPTPGWQRGIIDPQDARRHDYDFGNRQLRFKEVIEEPKEVPEMTLDEIRTFLTRSCSSLKQAFDKMDFFKNGKLSCIEWQEGIYNLVAHSFGTDSHKFRMAIVPRKQFNARMKHLFYLMDTDGDGLISFEEISSPYLEPEESSHAFTRRRKEDRVAYEAEKLTALSRSMLTGALARSKGPPAHHGNADLPEALSDFVMFILKSFVDVNAVFARFDEEDNGQLNLDEFVQGARRINYKGNAADIFKLLDCTETGTINKEDFLALRELPTLPPSETRNAWLLKNQLTLSNCSLSATKKDATIARKMRSPIRDPPTHVAGTSLSATDLIRPLGESMRTATGFYTFPRTTTARLDVLLHPNERPGEDAEQFSPEHGPGFVQKGPEYNTYMGLVEHPQRGNGWKKGANLDRSKRFGAVIMSVQGQVDRDHSGMGFATYEGREPSVALGNKIHGAGALSFGKSPVRPGITLMQAHKPCDHRSLAHSLKKSL